MNSLLKAFCAALYILFSIIYEIAIIIPIKWTNKLSLVKVNDSPKDMPHISDGVRILSKVGVYLVQMLYFPQNKYTMLFMLSEHRVAFAVYSPSSHNLAVKEDFRHLSCIRPIIHFDWSGPNSAMIGQLLLLFPSLPFPSHHYQQALISFLENKEFSANFPEIRKNVLLIFKFYRFSKNYIPVLFQVYLILS